MPVGLAIGGLGDDECGELWHGDGAGSRYECQGVNVVRVSGHRRGPEVKFIEEGIRSSDIRRSIDR